MPAPTGAHTTLHYLWEDAGFASSPNDTDNKPFGGNATLSQMEGSNNVIDIFQPNNRQIEQLIAQHFDGAFTVDFEVSNPWWLRALFGEPTTVDNTDGTYTHTWDGKNPTPMRITAGYEPPATDSGGEDRRVLEGCVVSSATVDTSVEDTGSVSLTGAYANENYSRNTALDPQPDLQYRVLTFAQAALSLEGTTLSLVQDASVEIENNVDLLRELGTRVAVDYSPKAMVPSVDYTRIRVENSEQDSLYGSQGASTVQEHVAEEGPLQFAFDNGGLGGEDNQMQLDLSGSKLDSLGNENLGNPQEDLQESINRKLRDLSAEATNNTAAAR